jgi:hypothetical protein
MNGVVVPDKIECIYVNLFLFPFPAHDNAVRNVCKYTPALVLAEVKNSLGPGGRRGGFVCANTCRLFAYRSGVIVGAIEVQVDIANAKSRRYGLWLWKGGEDDSEGGERESRGERTG